MQAFVPIIINQTLIIMKVAIVGAGIGGLTLAVALQQKGIPVEVFEAAPAFKRVGAGIVIALNALQIFDRLGIAKAVQEGGMPIEQQMLTNAALKPLAVGDNQAFHQHYGLHFTAIHRANLHEILLHQLNEVPVHLGKQLKGVEEVATGVELSFADGSTTHCDVLVGADGIHSMVRQQLFPSIKERLAGQVCWRGIAKYRLSEAELAMGREAWGKRSRFGIFPISKEEVYWFACANDVDRTWEQAPKEEWQALFDEFNPLVKELLAATPASIIITAPLSDLELLPQWYQGRIVLMGDAAHATTPNMGQGANQAVESAWVLAEALQKAQQGQELQAAFAWYQTLRQKKAQQIIKNSWNVGRLAQVEQPILRWLRNLLLRITPSSVAAKQLERLFQLPYLE